MPRSLAQQLHDVELRFGERNLLGALRARHLDAPSTEVDRNIGIDARLRRNRRRPAILAHQVRPDAFAQHIEREGLYHVIVPARRKPVDLVGVLHAGGEEYDGARQQASHAPAELEAVHARHIDVQQHDIDARCSAPETRVDSHKRFPCAVRDNGRIALKLEILLQHSGYRLLIIYDEHPADVHHIQAPVSHVPYGNHHDTHLSTVYLQGRTLMAHPDAAAGGTPSS